MKDSKSGSHNELTLLIEEKPHPRILKQNQREIREAKYPKKKKLNVFNSNNSLAQVNAESSKSVDTNSEKNAQTETFYLFIFFGVLLNSLYYTFISNLKGDLAGEKIYHSLFLGFFIIIDILLSPSSNKNLSEPLLNDSLVEMNEKKEYIFFMIIMGIIKFMTELSMFYLLRMTENMGMNIALGFSLTSFEYIMLKIHFCLKKKRINLKNSIGPILILVFSILIMLIYLDLNIGALGVSIAILKITNYYMQVFLMQKKIKCDLIVGSNLTDFIIGALLFLVYLAIKVDKLLLDNFEDYLIICFATAFYYFNARYFFLTDK